jgi:hypothetical protein
MKKSIAGLALLSVIASVAYADEKAADPKPTLEAECRAIAESHGVAPDQMGDWMKRCQERTKEAQRRMEEMNETRGAGGMQQGNPGDMSVKPGQEGK